MSLARAWTRQLYGAWGAALIVPGTIVAALALLALAGGFGQLGALGQAFAGPSVPVAVNVTSGLGNTPARTSIPPAPPAAAATGTALVSAGTPASGPVAPGAAGNGNGTGTGAHPNGGSAGFGGRGAGNGTGHGGRSGSPGPGTTPTPTSPSPTPPASQPTLVDGVIDLGTSITSQIPGPVGAAATQLLQGVGKSVDEILPLTPKSSTATSSSQAGSGTSATTSAQ